MDRPSKDGSSWPWPTRCLPTPTHLPTLATIVMSHPESLSSAGALRPCAMRIHYVQMPRAAHVSIAGMCPSSRHFPRVPSSLKNTSGHDRSSSKAPVELPVGRACCGGLQRSFISCCGVWFSVHRLGVLGCGEAAKQCSAVFVFSHRVLSWFLHPSPIFNPRLLCFSVFVASFDDPTHSHGRSSALLPLQTSGCCGAPFFVLSSAVALSTLSPSPSPVRCPSNTCV